MWNFYLKPIMTCRIEQKISNYISRYIMVKSVKPKYMTHSLYSLIQLKTYFVVSTLIITMYSEIYF